MDRPKIRPVEPIPVPSEGRMPLFFLRDPERLSDQALTVSLPALAVIQFMDGQSSLADIREAFHRHFGQTLPAEELDQLVLRLDELYLLDSARSRERKAALAEAFRRAEVREPTSAGGAYPDDPEECRRYLRRLFEVPGRGGMPSRDAATGDLVGLIAPHIDTDRGQAAYVAAYRELAEHCDAETFILLGTCHQPASSLYIATAKDFRTPLGRTETDRDLLQAIARRAPLDLFAEELVHKTEHSLEFQVLLLQFVLDGRPHRIVPLLCNSPLLAVGDGGTPGEAEPIVRMARAVREAVQESGRRVAFIAGADLAHVGRQFGDDFPVGAEVLYDLRRRDLEMLRHVTERDPDGFFRYIRDEQDRRRICGLGPIDALLRFMDADRGEILLYDQWAEASGYGSVTFASVGFYRGEGERR